MVLASPVRLLWITKASTAAPMNLAATLGNIKGKKGTAQAP
jgi:hypothetical protein